LFYLLLLFAGSQLSPLQADGLVVGKSGGYAGRV